ncbi:MAG: DUF4446 family protein [Chloroflexi bacterium]|nr:DUF4446 family protein [Chloroflexota bacterium]HOS79850.1 DUF4446 family protein [Anaerolineae bacterium]HQJ11044.1 DUF4446 family protein [Anaerolineae bacterium]HUM37074.1 DUF4446 family protein [Anaerolineae bacterium]
MESILIPWVVAATVLLFVAAYWIYTLEKRFNGLEKQYRRLLTLAESGDQATLADFLHRLEQQNTRLQAAEKALTQVEAILPHTLQGYGIQRYQGFANVGGDQSFSLALVDGHGSGFVLSGLHGRDETRVYAKPLVQWRASYTLSAEEQAVLATARQMMESKS